MDPQVNQCDVVIKVKCGDTLRRFAAHVHGGTMDHDMNKLRAKIINLFKFSPYADLVLTYTDEDGDVVTLVDDEELFDAVIRQQLNPLRIDVQLKTNYAERYETKSHLDSSTRRTSSPIQRTQTTQVNTAIDEALQSVPDPFRSALSKLSLDFISKVEASTPALAEFVEYYSKLVESHLGQHSLVPSDVAMGRGSASSSDPVDLDVSDRTKSLPDQVSECTFMPSSGSVQTLENNPNQTETGNRARDKGTSAPALSVDSNLDMPEFTTLKELVTSSWVNRDNVELGKEENCQRHGKSVAATSPLLLPNFDQMAHHKSQNLEGTRPSVKSIAATTPLLVPINDQMAYHKLQKIESTKPPAPVPRVPGIADVLCNVNSKHIPGIPSSTAPSTSQSGLDPQIGLPVSFCGPASDPTVLTGFPQIFSPHRRAYGHYDSMLRTFHRGVQCDGCGMHPIMGPRFKSNVKEDYDLCSICFSEMGNEADYTRIDRAPYRSARFLKEFYNPRSRFQNPHGGRGFGTRSSKGKLESRFIQDVTIVDGTLMAPSTPFTKIWKMRNNGTTAWASGTQLVWIGGDQFGERASVELEIAVNGFPVDGEIDVAVDFRAPPRPGRYISYWRMASPSGQKFGQRVWVLIQVENSRPNSAGGSGFHPELNLNLPPERSGQNRGLFIIDVNEEPLDAVHSEPDLLNTNIELLKPLVDVIPGKNVGPVQVDGLPSGPPRVVDEGLASPVSQMAPSVSYPMIDLSEPSSPSGPPAVVPQSGGTTNENPVEQTLLMELEDMGFSQMDLNKEVLRLNDYDMEQSLNDLCGIADWDPILEDLQEMGFSDKEMNKKLLIKNGGSIKRVVLDLIAGEKA